MARNRNGAGELFTQRLCERLRILAFQHGVQLRSHLQEFSVARLPDFQKRPRIEPALHGTALMQAILEFLADQVFLQALTARVFQNAGEPQQLLSIQFVEGILRHRSIGI